MEVINVKYRYQRAIIQVKNLLRQINSITLAPIKSCTALLTIFYSHFGEIPAVTYILP